MTTGVHQRPPRIASAAVWRTACEARLRLHCLTVFATKHLGQSACAIERRRICGVCSRCQRVDSAERSTRSASMPSFDWLPETSSLLRVLACDFDDVSRRPRTLELGQPRRPAAFAATRSTRCPYEVRPRVATPPRRGPPPCAVPDGVPRRRVSTGARDGRMTDAVSAWPRESAICCRSNRSTTRCDNTPHERLALSRSTPLEGSSRHRTTSLPERRETAVSDASIGQVEEQPTPRVDTDAGPGPCVRG